MSASGIGRPHLLDEVLEPDHGCRCLTDIMDRSWRRGRSRREPSTHDTRQSAVAMPVRQRLLTSRTGRWHAMIPLTGFFPVHYTGAVLASPAGPAGGTASRSRKGKDMQVPIRPAWPCSSSRSASPRPVAASTPSATSARSRPSRTPTTSTRRPTTRRPSRATRTRSSSTRTWASPTSSSATATTTSTSRPGRASPRTTPT